MKTEKNETSVSSVVKRGPGRPKGSKNKVVKIAQAPILEKTDAVYTGAGKVVEAKRGPGRPKGSKNKNHVSRVVLKAVAPGHGMLVREEIVTRYYQA